MKNISTLRQFIGGLLLILLMIPIAGNAQINVVAQHNTLHKLLGFPSYSKNTGWIGGSVLSVGAYVEFGFSVGGNIGEVNLNGSGILSQSGSNWYLGFQGTSGNAKMNFGFQTVAKYKIEAFGSTYTDDIPLLPNLDFNLSDDKSFTPYLLGGGRAITLSDNIQPQAIIGFSPGIPGIANIHIGISLGASATNKINGVSLCTNRGEFTSDGQKLQESNISHHYTVSGIYEKLKSNVVLHFTPNGTIGIKVLFVSKDIDIPVYTFDYSLPTVNFNTSPSQSITFKVPQYSVNVSSSPSNGGSTSGGGTYVYGDNVTVTATANTGYDFANWTENGNVVSTNPSYSFTVQNNINLVANFSKKQFTVNLSSNPSDGGSTSGGGTYGYGDNVTVTATANTGYDFTNWTKNGNVVSSNPSYSFTVQNNINLVANFAVQVNLSVSKNAITLSGVPGNTQTFNINSNCKWNITGIEDWFSIAPTNGANDAMVTVTAEKPWPGTDQAGTIKITCENSDVYQTVNIKQSSLSGIQNQIIDKSIAIYPNPAKTDLKIQFKNLNLKNVSINLYNSQGEILVVKHYNKAPKEIVKFNLNNYPKGVYFIQFTTNKGTVTKKFIIDRKFK